MSATPSTSGPERLRRLTQTELDEPQAEVRASIVGGPRATGPQAFPLTAPDGTLHGPFGIMLHAPQIGAALQELGSAIRYRTSMSARVREVAILQVAVATGSQFEWWAHERVGRMVGLTELELTRLALGAPLSLPADEQAAHDFVSAVLRGPTISTADYEAAEQALGAVALVELTVLIGYYRLLSDAMHVFAVGAPSSE